LRTGAVIAAAGESRRMQGLDKILTPVAGKPVLAHSVQRFEDSPLIQEVVIVMRADLVPIGEAMARQYGWRKVTAIVSGGARRQDSVKAGLFALGPCDYVMIHDGARPCVTEAIIARGLEAAKATGAAIAAVPAKDTIKQVSASQEITATPPREGLWQVQTPQIFQYGILLRAYSEMTGDATDDAMLVERMGHTVKVFMASYENIKVTTPGDLAIAGIFLSNKGGE
jgi:2-C-methyl-D-erythritol 4-phosphate cytidylyltransferase